MKRNGFALLIIIEIIAILGVAGYFFYKSYLPKIMNLSVAPFTVSSLSNSLMTCTDYDQFLVAVQNLVSKSVDSTNKDSTMNDSDFRWIRKSSEALVTYPVIKEYHIYQPNARTNGSVSAQVNAESVSMALSQNLIQESEKFGLISNPLNTTNLLEYSGLTYQRFGFTKNKDLYSVVIDYSPNFGGDAGMDLNISCARADENYDQVYDSLNITNKKLPPDETDEDFQRNYVQILKDESVTFFGGDAIEKLENK